MDDVHFDSLDPEVQAFLSRLKASDVLLLEKSIDLSRRVGAAASVVRWLIITVAAIIVTVAGLGDAIAKIVRWFFGAPH
ncbi:hypothetical protein [Xanthobacter sp. VNH20]|uniref:hypothetical protein n=1 Tax=Xanthobacter sp. VNH20 TaxID=3156616 RepID=UPI0032B61E90